MLHQLPERMGIHLLDHNAALQLARFVGITPRTAHFMCHRLYERRALVLDSLFASKFYCSRHVLNILLGNWTPMGPELELL